MKRFASVLLGFVLAANLAGAAPTFFEANGVIDIEAEGFSTNIARSSHQWETTNAVAGFSGTGYVETTPNNGANLNTTWVDTSPELQYAVSFSNAVTHYVWILGYTTTNVDDSVHAGLGFTLPGATNSAARMTWQNRYTGCWVWTNRNNVGNVATISVGAVGTNTFRLWMREDGMRVDRIILATNAPPFLPVLGNAWHIPNNAEPNGGLSSMRTPQVVVAADQPVSLYNGNQFQGCGNAGNQATSQTFIYYKHETNTTWTQLAVTFYAQGGNNKYHVGTIPANTFNLGDTVQYYWKIGYTDRLPTFLYGDDSTSFATGVESEAQQSPFTFTYGLGGPTIDTIWGSASDKIKARLFTNSGYLQIVGQALDGTELGMTNTFLPGSATVGGVGRTIGAYLPGSYVPLTNGFEVRQTFGATNVLVRLTSPHLGVANVVHYEVVDWGGTTPTATTIGGPSDASEHFYGFGEKFNNFDQAGRKVRMLNTDRFGDKGDNSYKVAPWFISTKGYGFHLDSSALSYFDMRAQFSDRYVISNVFSTLKFNIVVGPRLADVLTRYTAYSGRPPLPPQWVFAPWMSSDIWRSGGEVRYVLSKYRERGIPGSAFVYDSPWETAYNNYTWNMTQFGNGGTFESQFYPGFSTVTDMMTFLRTNGFYAVLWMTPFVNTTGNTNEVPGSPNGQLLSSPNYAEGAASNYFVRASSGGPPLVTNWWKGTGSPVDFTNPNAKLWLQNQLSNLVAVSQSGGFNVIGGFKTDDGESGHPPEDITGDTYIPTNASYADGRTGVEMRNAYALEYHKAIWNMLGTNGFLFARSGFAGSQAYPGYWSGDNAPNFSSANGLPSVIVAAQSSAMSGFSMWASDVGGYGDGGYESDPANLFMRWTQFGAFSPLMQMHRQIGTGRQYPWSYTATALTNYQYFTKLHTALFPYIYSYAKEASTNGLPILRPLVLFYQDDPNVYGINHTYLFGNELLVSPIIALNATSRNVLLPPGGWFDYFTNQRYVGGSNVVWNNSNQMQMPLFVRDGAIVPMISTNVQTLCDSAYVSNPNLVTMSSALEFLIYPTTNSSFTVYDGTSVQCSSNGTVVTTTLSSTSRPILMRFFGAQPFGVERDGVPLPNVSNAAQFANATLGWRYDAPSSFLHVKFSHSGGSTQIRFGPDSVGDGISDSWRQTFFGTPGTTNSDSCASCDSDGDGLTNAQEYRAGTTPGDAGSVLTIQSAGFADSTNNFLVAWASTPGVHYRVLWKDEMGDAVVWQTNVSDFVGDGMILNWLDDGSYTGNPPGIVPVTRRFYKVIIP